jgi:hypothetical protein
MSQFDLVQHLLETYYAIRSYEENVLLVKDHLLRWAVYLKNEQRFVTEFLFSDIEYVSAELLKVRLGHTWGVFSLIEQRFILLPEYDEIDIMSDNFFALRAGGKVGTFATNTNTYTWQ